MSSLNLLWSFFFFLVKICEALNVGYLCFIFPSKRFFFFFLGLKSVKLWTWANSVSLFPLKCFFVFQCTDIPLPLFLHFPPKRFFLSGWVKQILRFKSLTWVKCGVNILNDVSSFWPLIILDEILTVNWSLSISKGNGEDPVPVLF